MKRQYSRPFVVVLSLACLNLVVSGAEYRWTGGGTCSTWYDAGNWESGPNRPGAADTVTNTNNTDVANLRRFGARIQPRLERNYSLGRITFLESEDKDVSIKNDNDWNPADGTGRSSLRLNGKNGIAFEVEDDPDGTLTFSGSLDYGQVRVGTNALALTGTQLTALNYEWKHILIDDEGYLVPEPSPPGTLPIMR